MRTKQNLEEILKVSCGHFLHLGRVARKSPNSVATEARYLTIPILNNKEDTGLPKQVILPSIKLTEHILFEAIKNSKEMGKN